MSISVFFFKQKTAYEMRISDWSSDVCSSDLAIAPLLPELRRPRPAWVRARPAGKAVPSASGHAVQALPSPAAPPPGGFATGAGSGRRAQIDRSPRSYCCPIPPCPRHARSEEHTSEIQSLMRISYSVFGLKKKNNRQTQTHNM